MNKNLNGKSVSDVLYEELRSYVKNKNEVPTIIDISIGDDFGGEMYAKMKQKKINSEVGFNFKSVHFNNIEYDELMNYLNEINNDKNINGVMIQLPMPENLKCYERNILDYIDNTKDVDGLTSASLGNVMIGKDMFTPCTPKGIITLLKAYDVEISGKNVCIINRSNIVGKPLEQLFLRENATTTICHSYTKDLKSITRNADIIVAALNKREYITKEFVKKGCIIIDVGVHKNEEGKTVGDVCYDEVYSECSLITPPTGGVGPMTICMLCYNSALSMYGNEVLDVLDSGLLKAKSLVKKM